MERQKPTIDEAYKGTINYFLKAKEVTKMPYDFLIKIGVKLCELFRQEYSDNKQFREKERWLINTLGSLAIDDELSLKQWRAISR